jgi:predicted naringenin-chalcone synthase
VISNSIFGDGAAAAVVDRPAGSGPVRLRLVDFASGLFPRHREDLRYHTVGGRLRNRVSRRVPLIGAQTVAEVARRLLERHGLGAGDIRWWAVHAGGSSVLGEVGSRLGLRDGELRYSREILHEYGNMSSPTVLFALERILRDGRPAAGDRGLLLSFGAGFSAFAALVEF